MVFFSFRTITEKRTLWLIRLKLLENVYLHTGKLPFDFEKFLIFRFRVMGFSLLKREVTQKCLQKLVWQFWKVLEFLSSRNWLWREYISSAANPWVSVCVCVCVSVHVCLCMELCEQDKRKGIHQRIIKPCTHVSHGERMHTNDFQGQGSKVKVTYWLLLKVLWTR